MIIPGFLDYLLDRMTSPFYILQYIFCCAYIRRRYALFGFTLLFFMMLTTIINYVLLYRSYKKIKDMAERLVEVEVIRGGQRVKIMNIDLVPGDVYIPSGEVQCDALILKGDAFMNEANLTGKAIPSPSFHSSLRARYTRVSPGYMKGQPYWRRVKAFGQWW